MSQVSSTPKLSGMKYRVVNQLGTGAGSTILLISDKTQGGKRYALKVVRKQDEDDEEAASLADTLDALANKWPNDEKFQAADMAKLANTTGEWAATEERELAMTVQVDSIYAVPTEIDDKSAAARSLAAIVHTDAEDNLTRADQIAHRLNDGFGGHLLIDHIGRDAA